jgi:hypothetical protein
MLDHNMKYILIILNVALALWPVLFGIRATRASDSILRRQVLELCDKGVIDTNALHAYLPKASDPAADIAASLSKSRGYFQLFVWPGALLAMFNAIAIAVFWKTDHTVILR